MFEKHIHIQTRKNFKEMTTLKIYKNFGQTIYVHLKI